jgi:hypothetical protein
LSGNGTYPAVTFSTYAEFIEALVAAKNYRNLSNQHIERMFGITNVDKYLGPSRSKNLGPMLFDAFLECFAVQFVMQPNPAAEERMRGHWEVRNTARIRANAKPLSIAVMRRAKALIFSENGRKGGSSRLKKVPPVRRQEIARNAALARWHNDKKINGF